MPINRAVQRAYEILVRRGLYPFEYRITIRAEEPRRLDQPHTIRLVETADGGGQSGKFSVT
jgi:hypothetical protein